MIAYIKGEVAKVYENKVILDVQGIGYQIFTTAREAAVIPSVGEDVRMHTYLHVKEDMMQLYGFLTRDDLEVFKLLLGVNGIGPKAALSVLSALPADDLRFAVLSDDVASITKAPGIGKKTAQKLILELKDKLNLEDVFEKKMEHLDTISEVSADSKAEAIQALTALGYSNSDALRAVKAAAKSGDLDTEELLKSALKQMALL